MELILVWLLGILSCIISIAVSRAYYEDKYGLRSPLNDDEAKVMLYLVTAVPFFNFIIPFWMIVNFLVEEMTERMKNFLKKKD